MALGRKTGGRQKGTPNKITASARDAFAQAFDQIGGKDGLADWATENRTEFYKLFARLIPVEIEAYVDDLRAAEVDDATLINIATGSGSGVVEAAAGPEESPIVH